MISNQHIDDNLVPVITIDGPSGSGKGTAGKLVAAELGFNFLDSGAIYRLLALYLIKKNGKELFDIEAVDENHPDLQKICKLAVKMPAKFVGDRIMLDGEDVTSAIRTEEVSLLASKVAVISAIRNALLQRQKDFRIAPGLVADGRDMGTIVFTNANLKIFLDASVEERAQRRYLQLIKLGENVTLGELVAKVANRDSRDRNRAVAPLAPAQDAVVIDSTKLSIEEVVNQILRLYQALQ